MLDFVGGEPPSSEGIGIAVAIVLLILTFGSLVAAGLPILTALLGLGTGLALVTVGARFLDIATFGPTLAAMIGLGVGIDYALFVINRHRQAVLAGRDPKDAAYETVATAGRAVVFAGTTVIIALLGLFVLNIDFMDGLAVAAALTVLTVMLTAVTLLPAVISLLGPPDVLPADAAGPRRGAPRGPRLRPATPPTSRSGRGSGAWAPSPSCWRCPSRCWTSGRASPTPAARSRATSSGPRTT